MSKTERARFVFIVKEYADGIPWIALEPLKKTFSSIENKLLGFDLPKGMNIKNANEIADYLNKNLTDLCITY